MLSAKIANICGMEGFQIASLAADSLFRNGCAGWHLDAHCLEPCGSSGYVHFSLRPNAPKLEGDAAVVVLACLATAWPLAALLSNAVSYAIPSIRSANAAAFQGLKVASLRRTNLELFLLFVGIAVLSTPFVLISVLEPSTK
jgi:hypothetical protein